MLYVLAAIQFVTLVVLTVLLLRKPARTEDPRLAQLLSADLSTQMITLKAHFTGLDTHLRSELAHLRTDNATAGAALRSEVLTSIHTLGDTLRKGFDLFRTDNGTAAGDLRTSVEAQLATLTQRFTAFTADSNRQQADSRETLHSLLNALGTAQSELQEKLRGTVAERLDALTQSNEKRLEAMRETVDEKLHATLQTRLTESFGQVAERLEKVHAGLGEMNILSTGVNDLNRLFSNVKSRGGFAEVQLGKLLDQVLAPGQYVQNANVGKGNQEVVEYAVRFPGDGGDVLLPIDAKFPREDWERLETAYEHPESGDVDAARRAFDAAIRTEGKRICSKYINEPVTTPYAVMFLPTEGLYAEVLRRDGLQAELHQNCRVMVAGPSNLYALLTSFQLGFRMLNLQKKGNEVWNVLAATQTEFGKFGGLMDKMDKQVGTVQNTIRDLSVRTRAINKTLREVSHEAQSANDTTLPASQSAFDGLLPMLTANDED